jgi:hypothetical protein
MADETIEDLKAQIAELKSLITSSKTKEPVQEDWRAEMQAQIDKVNRENAQMRAEQREARKLESIRADVSKLGISGKQLDHCTEWLSTRTTVEKDGSLRLKYDGVSHPFAEGLDKFASSDDVLIYKAPIKVSGSDNKVQDKGNNKAPLPEKFDLNKPASDKEFDQAIQRALGFSV